MSLSLRQEVAEEVEGGEHLVEHVDLSDLCLGGTGERVEHGQTRLHDADAVGDEEGGVGVDLVHCGHCGLSHGGFLCFDHIKIVPQVGLNVNLSYPRRWR